MNKELQDLAWACLPKEVRDEMKGDYSQEVEDDTDKGYNLALRAFFGHHNLTSDTEPSELLHVERKKVMSRYKYISSSIAWNDGDVRAFKAELSLLKELFGDKCLPDKEPEHRLEQASVQVEPKYKFSLGQKVILHFHGGEKGTISERLPPQVGSVWNCYKVKELPHHLWRENELDLYTEPEPKDTKLSTDASKLSTLDPKLSTETKDNMEEKELNLAELLKGCEGMELYTTPYGGLILNSMDEDYIKLGWKNACGVVLYHHNGRLHTTADVVTIYPSRALYEKYPLDACSAWKEWKESRKPKRWRAEEGNEYWYLSAFVIPEITSDDLLNGDDKLYECGNYFHTKEEAQQASEVVKEALQRFHEKNSEK